MSQVRNHFLAIKTNQDLIGAKPNQKSTRFALRVEKEKENEKENNLKKNKNLIPSLPKDLKQVVYNSVFKRLVT